MVRGVYACSGRGAMAEDVQYRAERFAAKLEERLTTLRGRVTADVTQRGRNSGVECQLPKLDVTGSNPVARSPSHETSDSGLVRSNCLDAFPATPAA